MSLGHCFSLIVDARSRFVQTVCWIVATLVSWWRHHPLHREALLLQYLWTVLSILTFCRFRSSTWFQYLQTVLQILIFGNFELHHYHYHHADLCIQFYRIWHSAMLSCIMFIMAMPICAHSSTYSDIMSVLVFDVMSIFANRSTDPGIRRFWVASTSSLAYFHPQAHTTSRAHATPQSHAPLVFSSAHLTSQAYFTPQAHITSQAHATPQSHAPLALIRPRTWLHKLTSLHKLTMEKRSNPTVCRWYLSWTLYSYDLDC